MSRRIDFQAALLRRARTRGDCSTSLLGTLAGRPDRDVRRDFNQAETPAGQLLRLHAREATPEEKRALVVDFAALIEADVTVFETSHAAPVLRLLTAAEEAVEAARPLLDAHTAKVA